MASSTDYAQEYGKAERAYLQGNYQEAAGTIDRLAKDFPDNPSVHLLRGHIYCYGLQQYRVAREEYELVLNLTAEPDFVDYANNGLEYANQWSEGENSPEEEVSSEDFSQSEQRLDQAEQLSEAPNNFENWQEWDATDGSEDFDLKSLNFDETEDDNLAEEAAESSVDQTFASTTDLDESPNHFENWQGWDTSDELDDFDLNGLNLHETEVDDFADTSHPSGNSVIEQGDTVEEPQINGLVQPSSPAAQDPFAFFADLESDDDESETLSRDAGESELETNTFDDVDLENSPEEFVFETPQEDTSEALFMPPGSVTEQRETSEDLSEPFEEEFPFDTDWAPEEQVEDLPQNNESGSEQNNPSYSGFEETTLLMDSGEFENPLESNSAEEDAYTSRDYAETNYGNDFGNLRDREVEENEDFTPTEQLQDEQNFDLTQDDNGFSSQDYIDFDKLDQAFGDDSFSLEEDAQSQEDTFSEIEEDRSTREGSFLDNFNVEVFDDDLDSIPDFSLSSQEDTSNDNFDEYDVDSAAVTGATASGVREDNGDTMAIGDDEMFSLGGTSEPIPVFNKPKETDSEPLVSVEQGTLAPFKNASLKQKQWITAIAAGVVSAVAVAIVSFLAASTAKEDRPAVINNLRNTGWIMALAAGFSSFGTTLFLSRITTKQIQQTTQDLQTQFDAVSQGNLNASATIYSQGEFGELAASFNQMARVILTTTSEAQRKAQEQEQAKEDLQRQVIRLLDDVEGAARGDLTVQAEVTADVLGAVADSFNLTIQNLREIVQQVKQAARQVTRSSTDSELFARSLSSDALRQAEELAVTLNSVQVMTDLIQRVAESAGEAESVARSASATALKGGEAVERTVAGILQIRETVAETTRKVKRLAESSQEISKIVAVISSVASRTNLLALNASIEAARAGEAGRGFAIVADEVRQLADRSAKALKEIEQIVLQIQSETGSVMTAMEEGTQQVIEGTKRAEQAKGALEDIVQVSNRIDALVRSIAADTVEQTQTSQAVAQVMQSVELTAQETSQEAQRVSGSLQNLVGVARDLLTSVERFRVESNDSK
ncbi:methyl-accepting chemotaxis protein [Lyngbya aestuarii]|uniref:methyl-accepting chemotaxis protein n=1 Tax=Lyngbya aestuarii TaxID=118322 RepID=UPI00403E2E1B